jgi:hypothetical protein
MSAVRGRLSRLVTTQELGFGASYSGGLPVEARTDIMAISEVAAAGGR